MNRYATRVPATVRTPPYRHDLRGHRNAAAKPKANGTPPRVPTRTGDGTPVPPFRGVPTRTTRTAGSVSGPSQPSGDAMTCTCPCHRGAGHHDGAPCPRCGLLDLNLDAYQPTYCAACGSQTTRGRTICFICDPDEPQA